MKSFADQMRLVVIGFMDKAIAGSGLVITLADSTRIPNEHAITVDGEDMKNFLSDHIERYYESERIRISIAYWGGNFRIKAFSRFNPRLSTVIESSYHILDANTTLADFSACISEMSRDIENRSKIAEVMEA